MHNYSGHYYAGTWHSSSQRDAIRVINPATEEVIGAVPAGTAADVDAAVAAACAAQPDWAERGAAGRVDYLERLHEKLVERGPELAELITSELGMPVKLSLRIQATLPALVLQSYIALVRDFSFSEQIGHSLVLKEPIGVVAAITPWNYPLHQLMIKVAAALAAGCTVVAKPSELAPLNAFALAEIIDSCGFPAGVFNLVSGTGSAVGEPLCAHPGVDMVSFTGSTATGKRILTLAAATVKPVALELGGKSAAILLDDADLATAVKATLNSCFLNSGQTCSAQTRLLVPQERYAEVVTLVQELTAGFVVGDPRDPQTRIGPLVSASQRDRVQEFIRAGVTQGAELLAGGAEPPVGLPHGYYVQPTVFGAVTPAMTIAQQEIFGPVLCIMTYADEEEAIRTANDSIYGLSGAVWSARNDRAERVARRLQTGQVDINGGRFNPLAPFGGYKQSGLGRELGHYGLEEFLQTKSLQF